MGHIVPPSQPSFFTVSMVTTSHIQLSFTVKEGTKSIIHFLLNTTSEGDGEPVETVITRGNQELVEVKELDQGWLAVKLMVSELHSFTRYTFQVAAVSEIGQGEFSSISSPTQLSELQLVQCPVLLRDCLCFITTFFLLINVCMVAPPSSYYSSLFCRGW